MIKELRERLAAHRAKRPTPGMRFCDMSRADYSAWQALHGVWLAELERIQSSITTHEHPIAFNVRKAAADSPKPKGRPQTPWSDTLCTPTTSK